MKWLITALIFGPITTLFSWLFLKWLKQDLHKAANHATNEYWQAKAQLRFHFRHRRVYANPGLEQGI